MRTASLGLLAAMTLVLGGCVTSDKGSVAPSWTLAAPALERQVAPELAMADDGALLLSFDDGKLQVMNVQTGVRAPVGPVGGKVEVHDASVVARGKTALVIWGELLKGADGKEQRTTWVSLSRDAGKTFGAAQRLNAEGTVVARAEAQIAADGTIVIAGLELDIAERLAAVRLYRVTETGVESALVAQGDKGVLWNDLHVAIRGNTVWTAWVAPTTERKASLQVSASMDGGASWAPPETIAEDMQIKGVQLQPNKEGVTALWMDRDNQIHGLARTGGASAWHKVTGLPDAGAGVVRGYSATSSPQGDVHLLYVWKPEQDAQDAVFHRLSSDGVAFAAVGTRINQSHPLHMATADWPSLAFDATGSQAIATWLDLRHFRPAIYANFSEDGGKTWAANDFAVSPRPGASMSMFPRAVAVEGKGFLVAWTEYDSTKREHWTTAGRMVSGPADAAATTPVGDAASLKASVSKYWSLRVAGDPGKTYELYDPYYRDRITLERHIETRTRYKILIHAFEIGELTEIAPGRYKAAIKYEHEVPQFQLSDGRKVDVPRAWVEASQEWIWVEGRWQVVYKDTSQRALVTY